ncbi:MAG: sulfotransferase [Myxococcota bacterium]
MKDLEKPPVFVVGNPKSGTSLMQSLLDGHPELFVSPVEFKLFKFFDTPSLPPANLPVGRVRRRTAPLSVGLGDFAEIKQAILRSWDFKQLLEGEELERRVRVSQSDFDRELFKREFLAEQANSSRDVYLHMFRALRLATKLVSHDALRVSVEKTPHLEEHAELLSKWFDGARFVHLLRNPYANVYSIHRNERKRHRRIGTYMMMCHSFYFLERNLEFVPNYLCIRYEDLVSSPEQTMRRVAKHLGIRFEETMMTPTVLGKPWGGNSSSSTRFQRVSSDSLEAYRERIPAIDIAIINKLFSGVMNKWDYELVPKPRLRHWIPSLREDPLTYLENRYFLTSYPEHWQ